MSTLLKQVIENIGELTSNEKVLVARSLISSLETEYDKSVDDAWGELAEKRIIELETGAIEGVSWNEIINVVRS